MNVIEIIKRILMSFLVTFAVFNIGGLASTDMLLGIVMLAAYVCVGRVKSSTPRIRIVAIVLSAIYTLSYVIYIRDSIAGGLSNRLFIAVYVLATTAGLYVIFNTVTVYILNVIEQHALDISQEDGKGMFPLRIWAVYTAVLLVAMIPVLLLNFPGTLTVDSFNQLEQVQGLRAYNDHHPWVHTMIIKAFYSIGFGITGDVYAGIATYTVAQMIIIAMSVAYAIASLAEAGLGRVGRIAVALGFILYPYNAAYAITMWKDVIFGASVLVYMITLYMVLSSSDDKMHICRYILLTISGAGMCMLRHNGSYAYIVTMLVVIAVIAVNTLRDKISRNYRRLIIVVATSIVTIALSAIVTGPVQRANGVIPGEKVFSYCVPLQQVAAVVAGGGNVSAEEVQWLAQVNTIEYMENNYLPHGADNMFFWVINGNKEFFYEHRAEFFKIWFQIGLKNPGKYVEAFFDQTCGYYTTMAPEQVSYYSILDNDNGLEPRPVIEGPVRIKINELSEKIYTMFPVYGILYSMGACLLILMLGTGMAITKKKTDIIIAYLPLYMLTGTVIIATPLVADLRYAFPLVLCMPSLIALSLLRIGEKQ